MFDIHRLNISLIVSVPKNKLSEFEHCQNIIYIHKKPRMCYHPIKKSNSGIDLQTHSIYNSIGNLL